MVLSSKDDLTKTREIVSGNPKKSGGVRFTDSSLVVNVFPKLTKKDVRTPLCSKDIPVNVCATRYVSHTMY